MELTIPVYDTEDIESAIAAGADAVYLRGYINNDALRESVAFCRLRGRKVYLELSAFHTDSGLAELAPFVGQVNSCGVDAVIVSDIGMVRLCRQVAPELPLHASPRFGVHNLGGALTAASMGFSRVCAAPEMSPEQLAFLCRHSPVEVQVCLYDEPCAAYPGQCYLSAVSGLGSANMGVCSRPCRGAFGYNTRGDDKPFTFDKPLTDIIFELGTIGVESVLVDAGGSGARRISAAVTTLSSLLHPEREGRCDSRVPVVFHLRVRAGKRATLTVTDNDGHSAEILGPAVRAQNMPGIGPAEYKACLFKSPGSAYVCTDVKLDYAPRSLLPLTALQAMREAAMEKLSQLRSSPPNRICGEYHAGVRYLGSSGQPKLNVQITSLSQLSLDLAEQPLSMLYVPPEAFGYHGLTPFIEKGITIACVLPRVIGDHERAQVKAALANAREHSCRDVLLSNPGHLEIVRGIDMNIRADFGMNVYNSQTLKTLKNEKVVSATLSFELSAAQICAMSLILPSELIVYGRLPLMICEQCLFKQRGGVCRCDSFIELVDAEGSRYPLERAYKCRGVLLDRRKLYLADRLEDLKQLGLWAFRLLFTTENAKECVKVTESYINGGGYAPGSYWRGFAGIDQIHANPAHDSKNRREKKKD